MKSACCRKGAGWSLLRQDFLSVLYLSAMLPFDTVLVVGNNDVEPVSSGLIDFLREVAPRSRRIGSTCTGAFILAEAGLLDGRRATTHWFHARDFQRAFPNVKMEEDRIFIIDGPVWTSAGMTSCIDLALALVEKDLGTDIAKSVARKLVVYHRRAGGQSQYSALLELESEVGSNPEEARLCQGKPAQGAIGRATRGGRASEPTPVQQGVSGGNRSITRQGHREPARGGGAVDDRKRAHSNRYNRPRCWLRRSRAHAPRISAGFRAAAAIHAAESLG